MRYLIFEKENKLLEIDSITGGMKWFSYSGEALNNFYFDGCLGVDIFDKKGKLERELKLKYFIDLYDEKFYHPSDERKPCPKYRIKLSNGDYLNYNFRLLYFKT